LDPKAGKTSRILVLFRAASASQNEIRSLSELCLRLILLEVQPFGSVDRHTFPLVSEGPNRLTNTSACGRTRGQRLANHFSGQLRTIEQQGGIDQFLTPTNGRLLEPNDHAGEKCKSAVCVQTRVLRVSRKLLETYRLVIGHHYTVVAEHKIDVPLRLYGYTRRVGNT